MKSSVECLKEIIEKIGSDWKKKLDFYLKGENENLNEEEAYFIEFINACKEDFIANTSANMQAVEKMVDNDLVFGELKAYVEENLAVYYAIEPLRILEKKDYEKAKKAVHCIFEERVIRYNPDIDDKYLEYEFVTRQNFVDTIGVLNSLSMFVVTQNLYYTAICEAVFQNTRLSKEMCRYIADKINDNFEQIRAKLIIEKLYSDSQEA